MGKKTHGRRDTPEYNAWRAMKDRCYNRRCKSYPNYGGRGITVCPQWENSFENFFADMGLKPTSSHSIDRKDNNGNYEPDNCRWATITEQNQNTRRTINITHPTTGESKCIAEWGLLLGGSRWIVGARLKMGWTEYASISTPLRR